MSPRVLSLACGFSHSTCTTSTIAFISLSAFNHHRYMNANQIFMLRPKHPTANLVVQSGCPSAPKVFILDWLLPVYSLPQAGTPADVLTGLRHSALPACSPVLLFVFSFGHLCHPILHPESSSSPLPLSKPSFSFSLLDHLPGGLLTLHNQSSSQTLEGIFLKCKSDPVTGLWSSLPSG